MDSLIGQKLYLRIWLAVVAAVAVLAPLVSRAPGKPMLAPLSDSRPPFDAAASLPALALDEGNPEG